jgi:predicted RNase H-like HicB family nuclease
MRTSIKIDREKDGRFIGEVPSLPGVLAYGKTEKEARSAVAALALRVLAEKVENGELPIRRSARFPLNLTLVHA